MTKMTPEERARLSGALNAMIGYVQSAQSIKGLRKEWADGLQNRAERLQKVMKEILDVE